MTDADAKAEPSKPEAEAEEEPPNEVEVPALDVGRIIGHAGSIIKRLIQSTGCKIEVPSGGSKKEGNVLVQLSGTPEQRRIAAAAIKDICAGGDAADHVGRAQGAMVLQHGLEGFERPSWITWRLVPTERAHNVKVEVGRNAVRLWTTAGRIVTGEAAERAKAEALAAIAEARQLIELTVDCRLDLEAENADKDLALGPLIDQYGVLVRVNRPEGGVVPIKVVGPADPARDVAELIEARYVKGKTATSVLQLPGQVQAMHGQMKTDFETDVRALEEELRVKVECRRSVLSVMGPNAESVYNAKQTLRDMLVFYFPKDFFLLKGLHREAVKSLRADPDLRMIAARADCAIAWDGREGTGWICGSVESRQDVEKRIDALMKKWCAENWEMDLEDYGQAMWLLGPKGTGDFLQRMQMDSGAKIKVCPNALKVSAQGHPMRVKEAEKLVKDALQKLEEKKKKEEEEGEIIKVKPMLTEHKPEMQQLLSRLNELKEKEARDRKKRVIKERDEAWAREQAEWEAANPGANGGGGGPPAAAMVSAPPPAAAAAAAAANAPGGTRERSRSRDRNA